MIELALLAVGLVTSWVVAAAGLRILESLGVEADPQTRLALALPLGGLVAWVPLLALGLAGALRPLPLAIVCAAISTFAGRAILRVPTLVRESLRAAPGAPASAARVLVALTFGAGLLVALMPASGADTLKYHLASPAFAWREGGIFFTPFLHFNQPPALDLLGLPGIALGLPEAQLVVHLAFGLGALAGVHALASALGAARAGSLAAVTFAFAPITIAEAFGHVQDWGVVAGATASLVALARARKELDSRWISIAAIASGWAASCKYPGLFVLLASGVVVAWWSAHARRWTPVATYAAAALVAGGPWYVRNAIVGGDPIWPGLYRMLGGRGWNDAAAATFTDEIAGLYHRLGTGPIDLFSSPFRVLADPLAIFENTGGLGIAWAALAPFALVSLRRRREVRWVAAWSAIVFACWFFVAQNGRFLWPAIVAWSVLAADGVVLEVHRVSTRVALAVVLAVQAPMALYLAFQAVERAAPVLAREITRDDAIRRSSEYALPIAWLNEHSPKDAVVAVAPETMLRLERRYVWVGDHSGAIDRARITSWAAFFDEVRALGATYVLLSKVRPPDEEARGAGARPVFRTPSPLFAEGEVRWVEPDEGVVYDLVPR